MSFPLNKISDENVQQWLQDLFEDEEVPELEGNAELEEILTQYMIRNKEAEKDAQEIIKIEQKYTEINNEKAADLRSLLEGECLSLSPETLERAETLAALGNRLNLQEPTLTNFLLAINAAENKEMQTKEREIIEDHHMTTLSRKVTQVMKTNDLLRRDLKTLEGIVEPQEEYKSKLLNYNTFLNKKIENYKYSLKKYERNLLKRNYDPSLQHHQLIQRSESVKHLEKKVQSLKSKLDSYQSLPPNESLTRLKIEATGQELSALQEAFQKMLESETGESFCAAESSS